MEHELDNLDYGDMVMCISTTTVCKFLGRDLSMVRVKDLCIETIPPIPFIDQDDFLKNYEVYHGQI